MTPTETVPSNRTARTDWVAVAEDLAPAFAARAAGHDADDTFVAGYVEQSGRRGGDLQLRVLRPRGRDEPVAHRHEERVVEPLDHRREPDVAQVRGRPVVRVAASRRECREHAGHQCQPCGTMRHGSMLTRWTER